MTEKEYMKELKNLVLAFRENDELCKPPCGECKFNTEIKLISCGIKATYCDILVDLYHAFNNEIAL